MQENQNKDSEKKESLPEVDGLELLEFLSADHCSRFYSARETARQQMTLLRILDSAFLPDEASLYLSKAQAGLNLLKHPNIAVEEKAGKLSSGESFFVLKEASGSLLAERTIKGSPSPLSRRSFGKILAQVLSGLHYAHQSGLKHGGLCPSNILLEGTGNDPTARIFGFAFSGTLCDPAQRRAFSRLISAAYMSPEACLGRELDQRADLYSLACIIYEGLMEKPLYTNKSIDGLMYMQINSELPSENSMKANCGQKMAELLSMVLSKNPEDRPANAGRMLDLFEKALPTLPDPDRAVSIRRDLQPQPTAPALKQSGQKNQTASAQEGQSQTNAAGPTGKAKFFFLPLLLVVLFAVLYMVFFR